LGVVVEKLKLPWAGKAGYTINAAQPFEDRHLLPTPCVRVRTERFLDDYAFAARFGKRSGNPGVPARVEELRPTTGHQRQSSPVPFWLCVE
jgi:hypothetical protein